MDQTVYQLVIRARDDREFNSDAGRLESRLGRIPGVEVLGRGRFRFGEADEHGVMEIRAAGEEIEISIPRPWVMERGPRVFALVFMTAEWCHGEVWDPQIGDRLQKDVVLQGMVAVRQARRERELREPELREPGVPGRDAPGPEPPPMVEPPPPPGSKRPWWKKN